MISQRIGLIAAAAAAALSVLLLIAYFYGSEILSDDSSMNPERNRAFSSEVHHHHRKLLLQRAAAEVQVDEPNRMWGEKCSKSDIVVNQGPTAPLPNGIPTYTVEIMNVCANGCDISNIHLSCGWFSSARMINPKVFKRLRYDDCVVNDGKSLVNGGTLSFQYANTFRYPLSVSYVNC